MRDFPAVTEESIKTGKLLEKLRDRGLEVNPNMLALDVQDGYLPSSEKDSDGNKSGVFGSWDAVTVRRAIYLYRLRKRGIKGQTLKVLLFYRDGWGWEEVKPICLTGLRKVIYLQERIIYQKYRKPTIKDVEDVAHESPFKPETAAFILGVGFTGKPFEKGSLKQLFANLYSTTSKTKAGMDEIDTAKIQLIEEFFSKSNLTWKRMIEIVEQANAEQAAVACALLKIQIPVWRNWLHNMNLEQNLKRQSTNPFTLCGKTSKELTAEFRSIPSRITPAQLLAFMVAPALIMQNVMDDETKAEFLLFELMSMLIQMMKS